jgi:hypothetical protein
MPRYSISDLQARGSLALVSSERTRQASPAGEDDGEGYHPDHDVDHENGELADAACAYATTKHSVVVLSWPQGWGALPIVGHPTSEAERDQRVTDLVKAGALILAELDRLARAGGA